MFIVPMTVLVLATLYFDKDFLVGIYITLVIGATLSASTFGSHACFYSDATVLTAQAAGCTPFQHAITQIPYALIAAAISVAGYLLIAYV